MIEELTHNVVSDIRYFPAPCPTCHKDNGDIVVCPYCYSCVACHDVTDAYYHCPGDEK